MYARTCKSVVCNVQFFNVGQAAQFVGNVSCNDNPVLRQSYYVSGSLGQSVVSRRVGHTLMQLTSQIIVRQFKIA